jgi:hypothetical protein
VERYSRKRAIAATSGTLPMAATPRLTTRSRGAPRWGVPRQITSVTRSVHESPPWTCTAQAWRRISPPIEWPTSAMRRTSVGHARTSRSRIPAIAAPFSAIGNPVFTRT